MEKKQKEFLKNSSTSEEMEGVKRSQRWTILCGILIIQLNWKV